MQQHSILGHEVYLAPVYLACVVLGMVGLVLAPGNGQPTVEESHCQEARCDEDSPGNGRPTVRTSADPSAGHVNADEVQGLRNEDVAVGLGEGGSRLQLFVGLLSAVNAGLFSALQFACVTVGKRWEYQAAGCENDPEACPAKLKEQFNNFGSWMGSFGLGAGLLTLVLCVLFSAVERRQKRSFPDMHFRLMLFPGNIAGFCWVLGNFFQLAAVVQGGNSVMVPANQTVQLITAGLWGLLYFREVTSPLRIASWSFAALWTLIFIVLLSKERISS